MATGFTATLYVADFTTSGLPQVERYQIALGVPVQPSNLTYSSVGAPIAVDASNRLYATVGSQVRVFQPRSNLPLRKFDVLPWRVQNVAFVDLTALTVDPQGYTYVAYEECYATSLSPPQTVEDYGVAI